MRCKADGGMMMSFVDGVGNQPEATKQIMDALKCSWSKADKLARGEYPFGLNEFEQVELSKLTKRPMDRLFPDSVRKQKPRAV